MLDDTETTLEGTAGDPGGGPYVTLRLTLRNDMVVAAGWESNGCPAAQTAACGMAAFAKGRTTQQLARLDASDLLALIGGLPDGKGHYADLAIDALKRAFESSR